MIFKCNFLNSRNSSNILQLIIISITHQILKIILQLLNLILLKFLITYLSLTIIFLINSIISLINLIIMSFWRIIQSLYLINGQLSNNLTVLLRFSLNTRIILRWTTLNLDNSLILFGVGLISILSYLSFNF